MEPLHIILSQIQLILGNFVCGYVFICPKCSPFPGPNSVIIMDNASFHRSHIVRHLCALYGVKLIYLPPYSPHLNVVEHLFNALKSSLRKYRHWSSLNVKYAAMWLMQTKLNFIDWRSVAKRIGYHYHCEGL